MIDCQVLVRKEKGSAGEWKLAESSKIDLQESLSLVISATIFIFGQVLFFDSPSVQGKEAATAFIAIAIIFWVVDFVVVAARGKADIISKILWKLKCCGTCARRVQRSKFHTMVTTDEDMENDQAKMNPLSTKKVAPVPV